MHSRHSIWPWLLGVGLACGMFGGYAGYLFEAEHQLHGVEPGAEANWALTREAAFGFALGAALGVAALSAFVLAVRAYLKRA
jgi:hypothetical protein